jgi:alkaline phosphatase D
MRLYEAMRQAGADVFIHTGDTIYADAPLPPEVKLDDGRVWRNVVTPEKSKVAETLDEFRGNHRYNLLDENVRRFNASISQFVIWDDHEVLNNWYPTEILGADMPHSEHSVALLAARAKRAFQEYTPMRFDPSDPERIYRAIRFGPLVEIFGFDMRSYRGPNSTNRQPVLSSESAILGSSQVAWLKGRLANSRATWKIIASDMPLSLTVVDGPLFEAVANGDHGAPLGRELEIASLLRFIRDQRIRNVVFVTGDVHYCAAHHYDPSRASFTEFHPFWEFVAGPAHAGTYGPAELDRTFGPEVKFIGIPPGMKQNRPPSDGFQFFGTMRASAKTHALTVRLVNSDGKELYKVELPAERG